MNLRMLGCAVAAILVAGPALAAEPVKIGFITTLSGPPGYIGQEARDAFMLAVEQGGGKLGGVPVEVIVEDDELKPDKGKQIARKMLESDKIEIGTGIIFSNVANAVAPDIIRAGKFYISPNAGPSPFAGDRCNENYFVASWQNDNLYESAAVLANEKGVKKMLLMAPNYQAGKDAIAGFKRIYKGEVVEEIFSQVNQTDYAAEIAKIRDAKPDALFVFLPGGMGIAFGKQYAQAGLSKDIPLIVGAPNSEARLLNAIGDAMVGTLSTSHWNATLDNPTNKAFVEAFQKKYNRVPIEYSQQAYDTALLIGAALKAVNGDMSKKDEFRAALRKADVPLTRGAFKFNTNHHPIQNWYAQVAEKGPDGKMMNKVTGVAVKDHKDAYYTNCPMKW